MAKRFWTRAVSALSKWLAARSKVDANAVRLANREPLAPLAVGNDEIDQLARALDRADLLLRERESELRSTNEFLEHIIASGPVVVLRFDADGAVRYISPNVSTILGFAPEELVGAPDFWWHHMHPEDRERVVRDFQAALERNQGWLEHEYRGLHRDGSYRWIQIQARVERDANGNFSGGLAYVLDVTARKQAERDLLAGEERYRLMTECSADIISRHGPDGTILYVSQACQTILGYRPDELVGRNPLDLIDPADLPDAVTDMNLLATRGASPWICTLQARRRDGTPVWLEATVRVVVDPASGAVRELQACSRDISGRKAAEEALRASGEMFARAFESSPTAMAILAPEDLRLLRANEACLALLCMTRDAVIGRTPPELGFVIDRERSDAILAELERDGLVRDMEMQVLTDQGEARALLVSAAKVTMEGAHRLLVSLQDVTSRKQYEEEIRRAREEAERANRAKSEFLSRMSHELRTPLNAILGFSQLLAMDNLTAEQQESVHAIAKAGDHLLGLINEVLDISRIEAGRLALSLEPIELAPVLRCSLEMISPLAASHSVRLEIASAVGETLGVVADGQRLKQALLNLLSNAVKYNRRGGWVYVTVASVEDTVQIAIRDTGIGIAPDQIHRLFVPFERLGAENSDVEGTGLGLAFAKGIIEQMGGRLAVESAVGEGSTFRIELPLVPAAEGVLAAARDATVLYVEDNASNRRLMRRILAQLQGIRYREALDAAMGLAMARQERPALILLDLQLPDLDGRQLLQQLKSDPTTREIPVVIVSVDATPAKMESLVRDGAREYLTKPIDVTRVLQIVESVVERGAA